MNSSLYQRCQSFKESNKELVFKKIYDEINLILLNNKLQKHIQIENLYLFIILKELGRNYRINNSQIKDYFKLSSSAKTEFEFDLNYFTITVLLFYIRNIKQYVDIKNALKNVIVKKIEEVDISKRRKTTELVMLFFDILVCPYLDNKFKRKIMILFNITSLDLQSDFLNFKKERKYWFTKWDNFNLSKELLAKKSLEVY